MDYSPYKQFELRRKFWKFFGAEISLFDTPSQAMIGFIKMKAWKLREDVRLYTDKSMQQEVLSIRARQILDIGATYDVFDSASSQLLFSLRRKGLTSVFVRDHWLILDAAGNEIGNVRETSGTLALLRRWLSMINDLLGLIFAFVPQTYDATLSNGGTPAVIGKIVHKKNPFLVKMAVDTSMAQVQTDPRMMIAVSSMLSIIDAAKNN